MRERATASAHPAGSAGASPRDEARHQLERNPRPGPDTMAMTREENLIRVSNDFSRAVSWVRMMSATDRPRLKATKRLAAADGRQADVPATKVRFQAVSCRRISNTVGAQPARSRRSRASAFRPPIPRPF